MIFQTFVPSLYVLQEKKGVTCEGLDCIRQRK